MSALDNDTVMELTASISRLPIYDTLPSAGDPAQSSRAQSARGDSPQRDPEWHKGATLQLIVSEDGLQGQGRHLPEM